MFNHIKLTAVLVLLMVVLAGCSTEKNIPTQQSAGNNPKVETILERRDNHYLLDGIKLHMTRDQVIAAAGEPKEVETVSLNPKIVALKYPEYTVWVSENPNASTHGVTDINVFVRTKCTDKGIKVGDPVEKVREKYGKPDIQDGYGLAYALDKESEKIDDALWFTIKDGIVTSWSVVYKWSLNP